jgi:hypothetical protein
LEKFGQHCLQNSPGAKFVKNVIPENEAEFRNMEFLVNSRGMSDFGMGEEKN